MPTGRRTELLCHTDNSTPSLFSLTGRVLRQQSQLNPTGDWGPDCSGKLTRAQNTLCVGFPELYPFDYNLTESITRMEYTESLLFRRWSRSENDPDYTSYQRVSALNWRGPHIPNFVQLEWNIFRNVRNFDLSLIHI